MALMAFRMVSKSVFGMQVHPLWRDLIHMLRSHMEKLSNIKGILIALKIHVTIWTHISFFSGNFLIWMTKVENVCKTCFWSEVRIWQKSINLCPNEPQFHFYEGIFVFNWNFCKRSFLIWGQEQIMTKWLNLRPKEHQYQFSEGIFLIYDIIEKLL